MPERFRPTIQPDVPACQLAPGRLPNWQAAESRARRAALSLPPKGDDRSRVAGPGAEDVAEADVDLAAGDRGPLTAPPIATWASGAPVRTSR
jgi:hypothetical protein